MFAGSQPKTELFERPAAFYLELMLLKVGLLIKLYNHATRSAMQPLRDAEDLLARTSQQNSLGWSRANFSQTRNKSKLGLCRVVELGLLTAWVLHHDRNMS